MSWTDKQLKMHRGKQRDEATMNAFSAFLIISVAYLHDKQKFGKKRLLDFIDYVVEQMHFVEEYPDYFESMNTELSKETGVDVLNNIVRR